MIKLHTNQLREKLNIQKKTEDSQNNNRPVVPAGWHPQILANQLNLSQPGGTDYAPASLLAPPDLQTFLQTWTTQRRWMKNKVSWKKLSKGYDKESDKKKYIHILNVDWSRDPTYL